MSFGILYKKHNFNLLKMLIFYSLGGIIKISIAKDDWRSDEMDTAFLIENAFVICCGEFCAHLTYALYK